MGYHADYTASEIEDLEWWCLGETNIEGIDEDEEVGKRDIDGREGRAVGACEGVAGARSGLGYHDG